MNSGQDHLLLRRRLYKKLEQYPHPQKAKRIFDNIMFGGSIVGPLLVLPQIVQVWSYHAVQGVSVVTWGLLGVGSVLWFIYGLIHDEKPLMLCNALLVICDFLVVLGVLMNR
jgi:uncharacterized protein with PQ loop repeat